jgi:protease I
MENRMGKRLIGKTVVILIAEGYHEHEFWFPYYRFLEEGARVIVAAPQAGVVYGEGRNGKDGLEAKADIPINAISQTLPDILFLPGGIFGPLTLRAMELVQNYVKRCVDEGVLVCAICHAPWILISADVLKGRTVSCPPDMSWDVIGAGATFSTDAVTLDENLLTAEYFACLPEMFHVLFSNWVR